jgi:DNA-binding winged helix-turn-helix (wHTH) protein
MIFAFENFELDAQRLELRRGGAVVEADTLVLRALAVLVRNAGRLVSKEELVQEVWDGRAVADNAITVTLSRMRKALGDKRGEKEMVTTVYGRGYRFVSNVRERSSAWDALSASHVAGRPLLVGRERVLGALSRALAETGAGRGRLCALLGEPGIGKTHVVEAFVRSIPAELRASWGFCRETGTTPPLSPWSRALRELMALPEHKAYAHEADDPLLQPFLREDSPTPSSPTISEDVWLEGYRRHRVFDAITSLLARASERAPVLLVLEDLHCADGASLDLLALLLDELARRRIMIVATVRHAEGPAAAALRARLAQVLGHRNCERIALERLREPEVRAYVASVLGEREDRLARAVFDKSEGNPFFMAELCRQLRDRDTGTRDALALPQEALEIVRQHVHRLDADALGVLSAAAVIGRSFELWQLHAISGREMGELMDSLDAAIAADVLIAAPDSATAFAFGHELLRAVLYDGLSPVERRSWHVRVAEALEQRARDGESVPPSELAYHLHAGLPTADPRQAVHYCRLAAAAAAAAFANDDVVRYVRYALEALELTEKPSIRLRMHLVYLLSMYARGDLAAEYESATRELAQLARKAADPAMLVRAAIMFNLHPGFRQMSGARDELAHALELLPGDDAAMRSVALAGLAMASPNCFSNQAVGQLLDEAVPMARASTSRAARYVALIAALQLRGGPEHSSGADAVLEELSALAQQNPTRMPVLPVDLALYRAVRACASGELSAAEHFAATAAAHCRRLHHCELLWHAERMGGMVALNRGAFRASSPLLQRLHERARQPGLYGLDAFVAFDSASWMSELGGRRQLDLTQLGALAYDAADPPSIWSLKIRALASVGANDEARTALRTLAPRDLAALPCDRDLLGTLGRVIYAALALQAFDYAEQAALRLAAHRSSFCVDIGFLCEGSVPHLLGSVALALGDADRAVSELSDGLAREERAGFLLCAGYTRVELGRALLRRGRTNDRSRARQLWSQAHTQAERTGLQRLAHAASTQRDGTN